MHKKLVLLLLAIFLLSPILVNAEEKEEDVVLDGLQTIEGRTYYYENGEVYKGFKTIGDNIYYFGRGSGALQKNQWYNYDGKYMYYFDEDGVVATGLKTIDEKEYYFEVDGKLHKGFKKIGDNIYYFGRGSGALQKNQWYNYDGKYMYYFDENGVVATGLQTIDTKQYYFEDDGKLHKGFKTIGNTIYYFGRGSGALQKNQWYNYDGKYMYYFDENGVVATGLKTIDEKQYYFEADGKLHKGFKTIGNNIYYFGRGSGALQKNQWYNYDGKYMYYFDENGVVLTGTQTIAGNDYYFESDGKLHKGFATINGIKYYYGRGSGALQKNRWYNYDGIDMYFLDANGAVLTGKQTIAGNDYYFYADGRLHKGFKFLQGIKYYYGRGSGALQKNRWYNYDGKELYYLKADGSVTTGKATIDGVEYLFNSDGVLQTGWQTIDGKIYFFYSDGTKAKYVSKIGGQRYEFTANGELQYSNVKLIIDVSANQGTIDWDQLWGSGQIDGVILRISAGAEKQDAKFEEYISNVKRLNIPYGIYIYSYAENYDEGIYYANFTKKMINNYKLNPTLGIYLDLESNGVTSYMQVNHYEDVVKGYMAVIGNAKIYTYTDMVKNSLNSNYIKQYITWIADYTVTDRPGNYQGWQYTSKEKLPGITENTVDMSIFYW